MSPDNWAHTLLAVRVALQDRYGLTSHQSDGYVMHYLEGKTAAEIARLWGIRVRGVNALLYEARQKIRGMR
ncbi:MAG: sigma factor-like helix-turn-helix DNA-binding protein [Methermicoccaceae archaeon]